MRLKCAVTGSEIGLIGVLATSPLADRMGASIDPHLIRDDAQ